MDPLSVDAPDRLLDARVPGEALARARLERLLDEVVPGGVGVVVAPAGSGKSTLMNQWQRTNVATGCSMSVTPACNDPVVFARLAASAISLVLPGFNSRIAELVSGGQALGSRFVTELLVEFDRLEEELLVVLDDLHLLTNSALCQDLDRLLEALPDSVRLVSGARWDPILRLRQLRLQGRLVEVRAADLAFDATESRQLVEAVSGRSLTDVQAEALAVRTDGWAAGLQLAALSLQRTPDVDAFIESFTGSSRVVADYLAEEVIDELEPELRRFLLRTSVLEWLDPELCDAVTGDANAHAMLDLLVRRSLFLSQFDGSVHTLRYHHLFADLLRYRLRAEPVEEALLRRRAASWLLARGHLAEAVEQLLAAGDPRRAVEVIAERGIGFFEREENTTLARWLRAARSQDPDLPGVLDVNLLAAQIASHDSAAAVDTYRRIQRRSDLTSGETAAAAALYACLGMDDLPTVEMRKAATEAIDLIRAPGAEIVIDLLGVGGRDTVELLAEYMLAVALLHDGDVTESAPRFEALLDLRGAQYRIWKIYTLGGIGLLRALTGRSNDARTIATGAIDFAVANDVGHHHGLAYAYFALALVAIDRGDRDAAIQNLLESGERVRTTGRAAFVALQRWLRIQQIAADAGPREALDELRTADRGAREPTLVVDAEKVLEIRLLIALGQLGQARGLIEICTQTPAVPAVTIDLEVASGDIAAARQVLDRWPPPPDLRTSIERLVRTAAVLVREGRSNRARATLQEALDLAEPEGFRRPFLDQPTVMAMLRDEALRGSQSFARSILKLSTATKLRREAHRELVVPLTEREREVLDYLPTRRANVEIAATLFISVNTLKSHLRHIYAKLAVTDRDTAVERAGELGLL